MTNVLGHHKISQVSGSSISAIIVTKRFVEKALKDKLDDHPTRDELQKRVGVSVTNWHLDSALQALQREGKILVNAEDGRIVWIAPDDRKRIR
ncbi:MAG TPA: hypothetical protein VFF30_20265 [Nitrososphaerales archaeon]|nr:hypothetical protein [Nitrososphaerales archaeon]